MKYKKGFTYILSAVLMLCAASCSKFSPDEDIVPLVIEVTNLSETTAPIEIESVTTTASESATLLEISEATKTVDIPDIDEVSKPNEPNEPKNILPDGFVYLTDIMPDVILDIRYYSADNFLGTQIDGYLSPVAILTTEAANALKIAADDLMEQGYMLKIFDGYRPQTAVDHFARWAADENDTAMKEYYYPALNKSDLFTLGYLARRSGHSRGSAVDLTIINALTGEEVDMGTPFDFFGEASHHETSLITAEQAANRLILRNAMEKAGFRAYSKEWWHYSLINEPFPNTYFDFPVK